MQFRDCEVCGEVFKKKSIISSQRRCDNCSPLSTRKNKHKQQQVRNDNMATDMLDRMKTIEKRLDWFETLFDIQEGEINTVVRDLEGTALPLLKEAVKIEVERIFDEKIKLVDSMYEKFHKSLSIVNTRIDKEFKKLNARPPHLGDVPENKEKPSSTPKSTLSNLQVRRLERAVTYLKRHITASKRELEETVWHDLSDTAAQRLLVTGVIYRYFIIDKRTKDKTRKVYRLTELERLD